MEKTVFISLPVEDLQTLIIDCVNSCLKHNPRTSSEQPEGDQLLTIEQAGEMLNLSVATLYDRVHKQTIPVCKRAGTKRLYFSKKALTDYILQGSRKTIADISAEAATYVSNSKKK